jgi:hypothetical protein
MRSVVEIFVLNNICNVWILKVTSFCAIILMTEVEFKQGTITLVKIGNIVGLFVSDLFTMYRSVVWLCPPITLATTI